MNLYASISDMWAAQNCSSLCAPPPPQTMSVAAHWFRCITKGARHLDRTDSSRPSASIPCIIPCLQVAWLWYRIFKSNRINPNTALCNDTYKQAMGSSFGSAYYSPIMNHSFPIGKLWPNVYKRRIFTAACQLRTLIVSKFNRKFFSDQKLLGPWIDFLKLSQDLNAVMSSHTEK